MPVAGFGETSQQRVRAMHGVGVSEQQPVALCMVGAGNEGVILAGGARRKRAGRDDGDLRIRLGDLPSAVGRSVVHNDDFVLQAGLVHERIKAGAERRLLVASGDDDGEFRVCRDWDWRHHKGDSLL